MNYVIWGAGNKGEKVYKILKKNHVAAFIDSDETRWGDMYCGVKIISFEEYIQSYQNHLIIVSMVKYTEIVDELNRRSVPYLVFERSSNILFFEDDPFSLLKSIILKFNNEEKIVIYGLTFLGVILYELLRENEYKCYFAFSGNNDDLLQKYMMKQGCLFCNVANANRILLADGKWDEVVKKYANCKIEDIYDVTARFHFYPALKQFKDIHRGKSCFIVGNGPSLMMGDLDTLYSHKMICFGVNMIYKAFEKTKWRPNYYVTADSIVIDKYGNDIEHLDIQGLFLGDVDNNFFEKNSNPNVQKYHHIILNDIDIPKFSNDISHCVYGCATVIYECLQFAIYMGFTTIYLLGVDSNYHGDTSGEGNHFIDNYYNKNDKQKFPFDYQGAFRAYQVAKRYAEDHRIKIYNATRGGKLEVFDRVDFDGLFKC